MWRWCVLYVAMMCVIWGYDVCDMWVTMNAQAVLAAGTVTSTGLLTASTGMTTPCFHLCPSYVYHLDANTLNIYFLSGISVTAGGVLVSGGATIADVGLVVTSGGLSVVAGGMNVGGTATFVDIVYTGTLTPPSDRRLKTDIVPLDAALDKINQLRGMKYSWINMPAADLGGMVFDNKRHVGVFAQDVEAVLPEAVQLREGFGGTYLTVDYQALIPLLIEAVRELSVANIHGSMARKNNATESNVLAAATAPSNDFDQSTVAGGKNGQHSGSSSSSLAGIAAAVKLLQEENKVLREAVTALQRDTELLHRRCDGRMVAAA